MESYGREYPLQLIRDWDKSMVGQREYKEALARNLYRYVVKGEELTEIGFQREFLGRIGQIVRLQALNEAELKALFLHPTKGVLSRLQKKYEADGIRLEVEDAVVDDIIRSVVQENLGARSLPNVMEQVH